MALLTNAEVERKLLERIKRKVVSYGRDVTDTYVDDFSLKLQPDVVADVYEKVYVHIYTYIHIFIL